VTERLTRRYEKLAGKQDDLEFLRSLETYLRALDRERPPRRVLRRLRDDVGEAVERRSRRLVGEAGCDRRIEGA
jgi:hypothetical protein